MRSYKLMAVILATLMLASALPLFVPSAAAEDYWSPTITSTPDESAKELLAYSYTPTYNETATIEVLEKPDWLSWDGTTFSGTPPQGSAGIYDVSIRATSAVGWGSVERSWTIDVSRIAFEWETGPITHGSLGSLYSYDAGTSMDAFGVTYAYIFRNGNLAGNATTGLVEGRMEYRDPITVSIVATDIYGRTIWQNYTIDVGMPLGEVSQEDIVKVLLSIAILGMLTAISLWRVEQLKPLAGFAWIACSLFVFFSFDLIFMFLGTGIGLWMLLTGVMDYYG